MAIQTLDIAKFESKAKNVYEAVVIASKRARQINDETRLEFNQRLEPVVTKGQEDDTTMNHDKFRISLEFEDREKPTLAATKEMMDDKLAFRFRESEE
ncbi:hypothetical protein BH10BAC5_BH10BAC5_17730 [soil metagenome]